MRKIIMVNGKKRSGKDYISDKLVEYHNFVKLSIAKSLKDIACKIAGIDFNTMEELKNNEQSFHVTFKDFEKRFKSALIEMSKFYTRQGLEETIENFDISNLDIFAPNQGYSPSEINARKFLQNMNIFKIIFEDDNIWINYLIREIKNKYSTNDLVIADFRFPNECTTMQENFGNIISVKIIGKNYYDTDEYDSHVSESSLNDWNFDYHINNTIWHSGSIFWQLTGLIQTLDIEEK